MKKSIIELVLEYYPTAKPVPIKNHYEIWASFDTPLARYLGQGKTAKQAWKAAYNNNVR